MIDTHAHIFSEYFDDIDRLVETLKNNNILCVLNAATSNEDIKEVIELSKKYDGFLLPVIGIHPENVNNYDLNIINDLLDNNKIYAIGEIGLDYHYDKSNKKEQQELFIKQINIAQERNLPIVVHSRESWQDTINILKTKDVRGVIHCFSGSYEIAQEFIKMGFMLGIGGVLTFKNSKLSNVIEKISLDNIVLETDSPYLTPEPNRGKKNNPSNVYYVAKKISEIKKVDINYVIQTTSNNARRLFDI